MKLRADLNPIVESWHSSRSTHVSQVLGGTAAPRATAPLAKVEINKDGVADAALELEAQRQLQIALALSRGAAAFVEYFAEGRGILRVEADIGRAAAPAVAAPIRMVPDVVGFGAELEAKAFVDGDSLEQSHVPIFVPGLVDEVADALCVESP